MQVVKYWELSEDRHQLFHKSILGEHHLAHVKVADTGNLPSWVDNRRCPTLCLGQHNVQEIICARDRRDRRLEGR